MTLSPEETIRYKRHLLLKEVGSAGQQRLKQSSVLVVGTGGLGSPLLLYLAAAGVGRLGILDGDRVSLDNLQRQIVHDTARVGQPKPESASASLARVNPHVTVDAMPERLSVDNALDIIARYDVVVDASDNFATRYLLNDACYFAKRPLVTGAVGSFDGYLSTFRAWETDPDGKPRPNYRCIFPEPPQPDSAVSCQGNGILGAMPGVVGTLLAMEVLKLLLGIGNTLCGRLLIYDALECRFETINVAWDADNPLTGRKPAIMNLDIHR
jgi:adenylyltransferase/sulfurtransferase